MKQSIIDEIMATAELTGTNLSETACKLLMNDLSAYDESAVIKSLGKCRKELKGRLSLAEIIIRIDDGRPGVEQAWAKLVWDEETTCVLTSEMQMAQGSAWALYHTDKVGARMAFKEHYTALVAEAKENKIPVSWHVSLGTDRFLRSEPIMVAVADGRLSPDIARRFIPESEMSKESIKGLLQANADMAKLLLGEKRRERP